MSEPFLGEIRLLGFDFAPRGWARCNGQLLLIADHQSLYLLLGTTYGGDGRTNFALPNLSGRVPMHEGTNGTGPQRALGHHGGQEAHTLTMEEMPRHDHAVFGTSNTVGETIPATNLLPGQNAGSPYAAAAVANGTMGQSLSLAGTNTAHQNMQPWLALEFCIATSGMFPSRS